MKLKLIFAAGLIASTSALSQATIITFDGNSDKGTFEKGMGTNVGTDVRGDDIIFNDFSVRGGISNESLNLAIPSFNINQIHLDRTDAYQDITPSNGGLGAYSTNANGGNASSTCDTDTDNLEQNLYSCSSGDEILFFDFNSEVFFDKAWFNGDHTEQLATNQKYQTHFNVFYSEDGSSYNSVFNTGPSGTIQSEATNQSGDSWLTWALNDSYKYFAIAVTGWNNAPGGYVEAINYVTVPEPATFGLLALGLAGLGAARRRKYIG